MHCNICGGIVISAKLLSFSQYDNAYLSIKKNPYNKQHIFVSGLQTLLHYSFEEVVKALILSLYKSDDLDEKS